MKRISFFIFAFRFFYKTETMSNFENSSDSSDSEGSHIPYGEEASGIWLECVADGEYEINSAYPYPIRRRGHERILKETIDGNGYPEIRMNNKHYRKHRVVALQFIQNDDPIHKNEIDHINHDRTNYHIENLRWISRKENNLNKSASKGVVYEYFDEIDADAIEITDYGSHHFEFYYYVKRENAFYFYNGCQYRKLHLNLHSNRQVFYVQAVDIEGKRCAIMLNTFKRLYDIEF